MTPRLLVANPNTSAGITVQMVEIARRLTGDRASIIGATAPFGAPALESEDDLKIAELAVKAMIEAHDDCDGVLIAAFGDPGFDRARSNARKPIRGLGEAGLLAAAGGGRRFAIITLGPALMPAIAAKVDKLGLGGQLALIDFLDCGVLDLAAHPRLYFDQILDKAQTAKTEASADAVLLGGAPFAGMAETLAGAAALPLFDGLTAGIQQLLAAVGGDRKPASQPGPATHS